MTLPKAVYDFRLAPLTFDFHTFLALSKLYFLAMKIEKFDLVLLKPFFRNASQYEQAVEESNSQNIRFDNIVLQSCSLIKEIENLLVIKNVSVAENMKVHFPPNFQILEKINVGSTLGVTKIPCNFVFFEQFKAFDNKPILFESDSKEKFNTKLITFSLRESPQKPELSSNFEMWFKVHNRLINDGYEVIVIPDHDDFLGSKKYTGYDWEVDEKAAISFRHRLRIYGKSKLNVASPAGWNTLLMYSRYSFLIPGYLNSNSLASTPDFFARKGPKMNSQPFWFSRNQRIDWTELSNLTEDILYSLIANSLKMGC